MRYFALCVMLILVMTGVVNAQSGQILDQVGKRIVVDGQTVDYFENTVVELNLPDLGPQGVYFCQADVLQFHGINEHREASLAWNTFAGMALGIPYDGVTPGNWSGFANWGEQNFGGAPTWSLGDAIMLNPQGIYEVRLYVQWFDYATGEQGHFVDYETWTSVLPPPPEDPELPGG